MGPPEGFHNRDNGKNGNYYIGFRVHTFGAGHPALPKGSDDCSC